MHIYTREQDYNNAFILQLFLIWQVVFNVVVFLTLHDKNNILSENI